jgi:hypothetical protein
MLALAFIMACAAAAATPSPSDPWHHAYIPGPIALTAAEIRRLFNGLVTARSGTGCPARSASSVRSSTGPIGAAITKAKPPKPLPAQTRH